MMILENTTRDLLVHARVIRDHCRELKRRGWIEIFPIDGRGRQCAVRIPALRGTFVPDTSTGALQKMVGAREVLGNRRRCRSGQQAQQGVDHDGSDQTESEQLCQRVRTK